MTTAPAVWPHFHDLNGFAKARLEQDFQDSDKREKCSRKDFTAGWIAMAIRHKLWTYFEPAVASKLKSQDGSSVGP